MTKFTWPCRSAVALTILGFIPFPFSPMMPLDALADSFNAKLGAWDISTTTQSTGTLVPPDLLAKMPPERRAQFEASMKARSGKPQTFSTQECLTKEDLDQNRIIEQEEEEEEDGVQCKTTVVSKSSSKLVLERTCPAPHPFTSHSTFEAKSPETLVGSVDITRPGSGKIHVDIKGRWVGASCENINE
jgi:hypothetical protein